LAQEIEFRLERSFLEENLEAKIEGRLGDLTVNLDALSSALIQLREEGREKLEQVLKELRSERAAADEEAHWYWSQLNEDENEHEDE
jgi:hypothetical protein